MTIIVRLDVVMAKNKIRSKELAAILGITEANLSLLKNGKVKGMKIETLDKLCAALDCQPGDLLEYQASEPA
ncbi:helix-turn-helix domain-containing protein [Pseudomonas sp. Fl5BN2]|jgi:putative transcriptional regulator|uniref:Transcriptional regulator n=2 Tax=Pseudomonas chlororaphis group TaxID=136842 RepID=A0A2T6GEB5_9PSED|nr:MULTISPECIES: helix-turn-helix transcriptional regulator [Pseudomonas]RBJ81205.1 transcriptional regulator [Pseudomonas sp. MWU12-2534b]AXK54999.1 transcriptional regulator [Pseudomonas protegens]MCE4056095.1 helix-turn-helix transcriptional regulator [Pseudomonas sp. Au-Pse12]MCL9656203.1 helix-turn-helix transcriptional regulator [Pseudomonas protegens]MCO7614484.1 helix-turn-helix transcriptional regulator [Pseudomonas chlororaphis]